MKNFTFILNILMMSLVLTIPSGSFFLPQYIANQIALNDISEAEVSYAIKKGVRDAAQYRFLMVEEQSKEWFYLAKILAATDKNIAFDLATIYQLEDDITQAIFWYKHAASLKHNKALLELIDLHIAENKLLKAQTLLLTQTHSKHTLTKLIDVTIRLGDQKLLDELISSGDLSKESALFNDIKKYRVLSSNRFHLANQKSINVDIEECRNSIQFFATNLEHLHKLDRLIRKIQSHPINDYFCFNRPRYISIKQLNCNYDDEKAIQCDQTVWSQLQPEVKTRYIGLMLNKGGANVDNGILYLDELDDENVFVHELSHLLGFVDEYPLPKRHRVCQKSQESPFAHNITVLKPYYEGSKDEVLALLEKQVSWFHLIDKKTPLIKRVGDKWKVGTPAAYIFDHEKGLGLFEAETCQNNSRTQAFKPTTIKNNLRYYEEPFIEQYLNLLNKSVDKYSMPSYHYNVAKSFFKNNNEKLGLHWLNKALKKEVKAENKHEITRYNKMKLGEY